MSRLGIDAVLLPIRRGTKIPEVKEWQKTTFARTQIAAYQSALEKASAIGVLLGSASQGLCSIDFDDELALEEFLDANPRLQGSLRTKGRRGANVWVVVDDEPPRLHKLSSAGKPIGEWRADGAHTIIAGTHPGGCEYSWIVDASPVRIRYSDIVWPWSDLFGGYRDTGYTEIPESVDPPEIPDVPDKEEGGEGEGEGTTLGDKIRAAEQARMSLKQNPRIYKLYKSYVEKRFSPKQGKRNSDLIEMVTFLFHAVGTETLMALVGAFYDLNQDIFVDSRQQHMAEAVAHLEACDKSWFEKLPNDQQKYVSDLPGQYREAFRICRDLAILEDERCQPGQFFISYRELSQRLGISQKLAERILTTFDAQGWLKIHVKGTRHQPGSMGKATHYLWMLPIMAAILMLSMPRILYNSPIRSIRPLIVSTSTQH